jgi:PHD/YefM family antitoxin component YafN of YafNO toxin-antitoxin module
MTSPEPLAAHGGARPPLRDIDLPYDAAAALADLAERADAHEVLHLVREHGPALMVMTEDDFDQAVEDAADLAEARAVLARMEPRTPEQVATPTSCCDRPWLVSRAATAWPPSCTIVTR